MTNYPADANAVGILRDLADELEAGRGMTVEVKIEAPTQPAWYPGSPRQLHRAYEIKVLLFKDVDNEQ